MPERDGEGGASRHRYPERRTALAVAVLAVAFAGAGIAVYAAHQPRGTIAARRLAAEVAGHALPNVP